MRRKRIRSRFKPQEVAFRSATWVSMLMSYASFNIGWMPQEHQGIIEKNTIRMEWWQPRCPDCHLRYYRILESGEKEVLVDKSDPQNPKCPNCGRNWAFARLYLTPVMGKDEVEFDFEVPSNSVAMAEKIRLAMEVTNKYFEQSYKALADLKKKAR